MRATQLILASASVFGRAARGLEALAAGTLTRDELRQGIAHEWGDFRRDREEVLRGLFEWEEDVFRRALVAEGDLLLIGCGSGRELIALASRGYRVTGLDPSRPALEVARSLIGERGLSAPLIHGFFEDAAIPGRFDTVVFTHRAYGLIHGTANRIGALRKAAGLTKAGGRIVVSYLSGRGMHPALRHAAGLGAKLTRSGLQVEAGDLFYARADGRFAYEHHFGAAEFAAEARAAGLTIDHSWDGSCPAAVLSPASR